MVFVTKFMVNPYSGNQREVTTLQNWLSNTNEIQAKIPKDFIATFLVPGNDVIELYLLEKEKEDIDDGNLNSRKIIKTTAPEKKLNDISIGDINENLEDTLNEMKEQIENNPDFIDELINGDLLEEDYEKENNNNSNMQNIITLTMFIPPEALLPLVNAGMLNPKDIKDLIESLNEHNDHYYGDDKDRQQEKDFGNNWRDWSPDVEDYFK